MPRDRTRLLHMLQTAVQAREFVAGLSREAFLQDVLRQYAVLRALGIIGEAARQLDDEMRQSLPQIPWPQIISMRNYVIHVYNRIDLDIVWETLQRDLPALIVLLTPLIPPEDAV